LSLAIVFNGYLDKYRKSIIKEEFKERTFELHLGKTFDFHYNQRTNTRRQIKRLFKMKMQIKRGEEEAQTAHLLIIYRCSNRGISCALI